MGWRRRRTKKRVKRKRRYRENMDGTQRVAFRFRTARGDDARTAALRAGCDARACRKTRRYVAGVTLTAARLRSLRPDSCQGPGPVPHVRRYKTQRSPPLPQNEALADYQRSIVFRAACSPFSFFLFSPPPPPPPPQQFSSILTFLPGRCRRVHA